MRLVGHEDIVYSLKTVPGSVRQLVSASWDSTVRLWDTADGSAVRTLRGHAHLVHGVDVSFDARLLLSSSEDKTVRVWARQSGDEVRCIRAHAARVRSAVFSRRAAFILTASYDRTAKVFDVRTGQCLRVLVREAEWVTRATFSADGRQAMTGSYGNAVKVWDMDETYVAEWLMDAHEETGPLLAVDLCKHAVLLTAAQIRNELGLRPAQAMRAMRTLARRHVAPMDADGEPVWPQHCPVTTMVYHACGDGSQVLEPPPTVENRPAEPSGKRQQTVLPPRDMWLGLPDDVVAKIAIQADSIALLLVHSRFMYIATGAIRREMQLGSERNAVRLARIFLLACTRPLRAQN